MQMFKFPLKYQFELSRFYFIVIFFFFFFNVVLCERRSGESRSKNNPDAHMLVSVREDLVGRTDLSGGQSQLEDLPVRREILNVVSAVRGQRRHDHRWIRRMAVQIEAEQPTAENLGRGTRETDGVGFEWLIFFFSLAECRFTCRWK